MGLGELDSELKKNARRDPCARRTALVTVTGSVPTLAIHLQESQGSDEGQLSAAERLLRREEMHTNAQGLALRSAARFVAGQMLLLQRQHFVCLPFLLPVPAAALASVPHPSPQEAQLGKARRKACQHMVALLKRFEEEVE